MCQTMFKSHMQPPKLPDCSSRKTVAKADLNQNCDPSQQEVPTNSNTHRENRIEWFFFISMFQLVLFTCKIGVLYDYNNGNLGILLIINLIDHVALKPGREGKISIKSLFEWSQAHREPVFLSATNSQTPLYSEETRSNCGLGATSRKKRKEKAGGEDRKRNTARGQQARYASPDHQDFIVMKNWSSTSLPQSLKVHQEKVLAA